MDLHDATALEAILRRLGDSLSQSARDTQLAAELVAAGQPTGPQRDVLPKRAEHLVDEHTFAVRWAGRICELGYTIPFRLFRHLAARANRYQSHEQLLDHVWEGVRSRSAIRSAVSDLRARLVAAGMHDLAEKLDGTNAGYYALRLDWIGQPGISDGDRTATGPRSDRRRAES